MEEQLENNKQEMHNLQDQVDKLQVDDTIYRNA